MIISCEPFLVIIIIILDIPSTVSSPGKTYLFSEFNEIFGNLLPPDSEPFNFQNFKPKVCVRAFLF